MVVPPQLRSRVMDELHEGHPGIGKMKSFARSYVWWPGLTPILSRRSGNVSCVSQLRKHLQSPQCIPGSGPRSPGLGCTLIMQAQCWGKHCSSSWMHIQNGSTRTSSRLHRQQRLSKNYVRHLPLTVYHRLLSLIMALHSLQVNSNSLCGVLA